MLTVRSEGGLAGVVTDTFDNPVEGAYVFWGDQLRMRDRGSTARAYEQWGVRGLPRTYVVGKGGRIIYDAEGGRDMDSEHIRGLLQALIDK